MNPPATGTALLILVGFVLPGFVAVLLKERLYEVRGEESTFDRLLTTVYYSLLVYLLPALSLVVLSALGIVDRSSLEQFANGRSSLWLSALAGICVLLVFPTLAAFGAWRWMNSEYGIVCTRTAGSIPNTGPRPHGTSPSTTSRTSFLLSSSRMGAAWPATTGSAATPATGRGLATCFLEERWDVSSDDGKISRPPADRRSVGVWIDADEIRLVDHYAMSDEHQRDIEERPPERT